MATQQYTFLPFHRPDQNFRLLTIGPGSGDVHCRLESRLSVKNAHEKYETVSYAWGKGARNDHIWIDERPFLVNPSVRRMMQRLRHSTLDRVVWIDAICIDQENIEEKEHQVPLMSKIYRHAFRNVIYLDFEPHGGAEANSFLCRLAVNLVQRLKTSESSILKTSASPTELRALEMMLSQPWFRRLWIMQEVVLAKEHCVVFGDQEFGLDLLEYMAREAHRETGLDSLLPHSLAALFSNNAVQAIENLYNISILREEYSWLHHSDRREYSNGLTVLLEINSSRDVSNQHDRVYGLLGLLGSQLKGQPLPHALTPEYGQSLQRLYTRAARFAIHCRKDLFLLRGVYHHTEGLLKLDGFPSWVPRWDLLGSKARSPSKMSFDHRAHHRFRSDKYQSEGKNPAVLVWRGFEMARVVHALPVFTDALLEDAQKIHAVVDQARDILSRIGRSNGTGSFDDLAATESIAANLAEGKQRKKQAAFEAVRHFIRSCGQLHRSGETQTTPTLPQLVLSACRLRRLIITSTGQIALACSAAQPGDTVAVLYNCQWPLVVRKVDSTVEDCYNLIGAMYLHEIMDGSAMEAHMEEKRPDTVFRIH